MAFRSLIRVSGMALLLGGVLWAISSILHPDNYAPAAVLSRFWAPAHIAEGLAYLLSVLGLVGFYLRQADQAGRLGLIGFILALLTSAVRVSAAAGEVFVLPSIVAQQANTKPVFDLIFDLIAGPFAGSRLVFLQSLIVFELGIILTGFTTMRGACCHVGPDSCSCWARC